MSDANRDKRSTSARAQPEESKEGVNASSNRDRSPDQRIRSQESKIKTYDPQFVAGKSRADMKDYVEDWNAGWQRSKPN